MPSLRSLITFGVLGVSLFALNPMQLGTHSFGCFGTPSLHVAPVSPEEKALTGVWDVARAVCFHAAVTK